MQEDKPFTLRSESSVGVKAPVRVRADLHVHTSYSKDCIMSPSQLVAVALQRGLTCLAITDHNSLGGAGAALGGIFVRGVGAARELPLQIIVGEEVRTTAGEIIGLFLQEAIPKGLTPLQVALRIKEQGGLVCIPHPFDRFRRSALRREALEEILPLVDTIEAYNSRNILPADNERARQFARAHNLLIVGGSDAHIPHEVGRTITDMPAFNGPEEFLHSLREARIFGQRSSFAVHLASSWVKAWRTLHSARSRLLRTAHPDV